MESKRKKRKVAKAVSAIPAPEKSPQPQDKPKSKEALIKFNAELVDGLFASQAWNEIVFPLITESIASVSGRYTNGRFYKGNFTKSQDNHGWLAGYQCALEEFNNNLHDFILERDKMLEAKKIAEKDKRAPLYNPFMEEHDPYETES